MKKKNSLTIREIVACLSQLDPRFFKICLSDKVVGLTTPESAKGKEMTVVREDADVKTQAGYVVTTAELKSNLLPTVRGVILVKDEQLDLAEYLIGEAIAALYDE